MKKKVIAVIGFCGMKRDIILTLVKNLPIAQIKIIFGMCQEHFGFISHNYFKIIRNPYTLFPTLLVRQGEIVNRMDYDRKTQNVLSRIAKDSSELLTIFLKLDKETKIFLQCKSQRILNMSSQSESLREYSSKMQKYRATINNVKCTRNGCLQNTRKR